MNVCFLSVMILTISYIINNYSYQELSIHCTLSIQSSLLLTTLLDTFIFPILQRGNWDSENSKCIVLATMKEKKKCVALQISTCSDSKHEICLEIS